MELYEYINESGVFKIDKMGILWEFVADETNIIGDKTYKSLIIPNEVKGFSDEFGRYIYVTDKFKLPRKLWDVGMYLNDWADAGRKCGCVFADSKLPAVLLPEEIVSDLSGPFAFGNAHIQELCIPESYDARKWNQRTFKGCTIDKLYVPEKFHNEDNDYDEVMSPLWRSQIGELYFDSVKINEIYVYYKMERGKFPADENSVLVAKRTHTKL